MESYGQSSTYMDHRVIQATLPSTHSPPGLNPSLSFKAQDQTSTPSSLLQSFYGLINHRATQSQAEMVFLVFPDKHQLWQEKDYGFPVHLLTDNPHSNRSLSYKQWRGIPFSHTSKNKQGDREGGKYTQLNVCVASGCVALKIFF